MATSANPPHSLTATRYAQRTAPGALSLPVLLPTLLAVVTAATLAEGAPIIAFSFVSLFIGGCLILALLGDDVYRCAWLFALAVLIRFSVGWIAWIIQDSTGVWPASFGTDAIGYWEFSVEPVSPEAMRRFNDPGFYLFNRFMTWTGLHVGGSHYMANLQIQIISGALLSPLVFVICRKLNLSTLATPAAVLMAFHPMAVAFSSILLRDMFVSALGFGLIALMLSLGEKRRLTVAIISVLMIVMFAILFAVRSASAIYFLGAGSALLLSRTALAGRLMQMRWTRKRFRVFIAVAVALLLGLTSLLSSDKLRWRLSAQANELQASVRTEADGGDSSSIATAALRRGWLAWAATGTTLHFIAPFPFYRSATGEAHRFIDYFLSSGALLNQLLLLPWIWGLTIGLRKRIWPIVIMGFSTVAFALASTLTFGDLSRYMTTHALPLMAVVAVLAFSSRRWTLPVMITSSVFCVAAAYAAYVLIKMR